MKYKAMEYDYIVNSIELFLITKVQRRIMIIVIFV